MSDYFHEQMIQKMLEPKERDFPCKECWVLAMEEKRVSQYIAEDKAQRMLLKNAEIVKALEDVRAEIEADIEFNKDEKGLVNLLGQGKMMAVQIIDRKIAEVTKNDNSY